MAAAGAKPAANSTSAAPSSTAKPAASSPFGASSKPATQGAFGGGFGATTTGTSSFLPLGVTTAASPFSVAVNPLTSRSTGPEKSVPPPVEEKDTAKKVKVSNASNRDVVQQKTLPSMRPTVAAKPQTATLRPKDSCFGSRCFVMLFVIGVVTGYLVIYQSRGLVRTTNLPKQTFWNYVGGSRKKTEEEAAAAKNAEEAASVRKKTEEEAKKKTETCEGGFCLLKLICSGFL
jgi:hypothetical protein